jgi:glycosyltransferase involved in cell wall biosynthesis
MVSLVSSRPTIALSMIVKNEAHVLARCLESVRPLITAWVIVDTGSTDGTQELVRRCLAGLPGDLHERPWKDFGHNRTEAAELARGKADYLLVIDADDLLLVPRGFALPPLTHDSYKIRVTDGCTEYDRTHFFRSDLDFRYTGVLHEVLTSAHRRTEGRIDGIVYRRIREGARSADPQKYQKDAAILEAAVAAEPHNARYAFYLAQSWRDAGELAKARDAYARRVPMVGFEEESYYSLLEVAKLGARLGLSDDTVIADYLRAFERRPRRAEPLCYLAMFLRARGRVVAGLPFARAASEIQRPDDILFVDSSVYAWRAKDEFAVAAYWAGRYKEALQANEQLLASGALPVGERARIEKNIGFCRERLGGTDVRGAA